MCLSYYIPLLFAQRQLLVVSSGMLHEVYCRCAYTHNREHYVGKLASLLCKSEARPRERAFLRVGKSLHAPSILLLYGADWHLFRRASCREQSPPEHATHHHGCWMVYSDARRVWLCLLAVCARREMEEEGRGKKGEKEKSSIASEIRRTNLTTIYLPPLRPLMPRNVHIT